MAKPGPMDLRLKTHPSSFPDPTFEPTRNPVEAYDTLSSKIRSPLLTRVDTSKGVVTPPKNNETLDFTFRDWARSSPGSGSSPDSAASSLTRTAWKPGHLPCRDHSDLRLNEPENVLKERPRSVKYTRPTYHDLTMHTSRGTPQDSRRSSRPATSVMDERARSTTNELPSVEASMDQEVLHHRTLLLSVVESLRREQGPSAAADIRLINTSLYHLVYILDVESSSFTDTVVRVSHTGQPTVFKPDTEFSLMLLQCGQILQDTAAEIAKHYFVSDPDPYKFDPGGVLAVHMEAGVPSEDKVLQLAALGLRRLRTGLKIIAQLQSVNKSESVAYTMNSKAQGYATGVVNDPPRVISPLAAYSEREQGLPWWNQEIPTPGTLVSDKGTQLPHPRFDARRPRPSVDPL
ncbi:hypothetical protein BS47DRAFT_1396026 [Hydnum rufescens UP504]|uniref:Uncharacterized protein n=1 Tax=Hydnum rufescens UP504 TaxID=1448309 RepID=A0A9P6ARK8_9AGAM|nr:hypothetical protein BS47DRAFT_1396026 [Hydnum rufescens UP504]